MSDAVTKNDLAAFFGSKARYSEHPSSKKILSEQNDRDLLKNYYAKTNQSLVLKIHRLEVELAKSRKIVEELRNENAMLKTKMSESGDMESQEKIDALLEDRIKRKIDRLGHISKRTIAYLQRTTLSLKNAFEEFGVELEEKGSNFVPDEDEVGKRLSLIVNGEPQLASVAESPPLLSKSVAVQEHTEDDENRKLCGVSETPTCAQVTRAPRRSELFGRSHSYSVQDYDGTLLQRSVEAPCSLKESGKSVTTPRDLFKKPFLDTPAVPWLETDTVRRKRSATLKIKTLAEPKLNNKLRRPGRNEEHPFISSMH